MLVLATMCVSAQSLGDVPATVSASDVTILKESVLVVAERDSIVLNSETGKNDTLKVRDMSKIFTPEEYEQLAGNRKKLLASVVPGEEWGYNSAVSYSYNIACVVLLYTFKYPSVDSDGNPIYLSALMGVPTNFLFGFAHPDNVIIGCHETITSNYECPSEYDDKGSFQSGNGMMLCYTRYDFTRQPCCLVIIPDYEGYGISKDRPHPYLYQELTARQVVDGVRSGLAYYQTKVDNGVPGLNPNWKSVAIGYSQGGSVALATHKFIEENGLAEELHFAGSVCGDGPYDPVAHLRYYMKDNGETYDGNNKTLHKPEMVSMPIVMPLILKGMCDSNPMMKQHFVDDYLTMDFLYTESLFFLESKKCYYMKDQYTTERINEEYLDMLKNGKHALYYKKFLIGDTIIEEIMSKRCKPSDYAKVLERYDPGFFDFFEDPVAFGKLAGMMTPDCLDYFQRLTPDTPVPTEPGLMQDLHRALESNNLTKGWTPQHRVAFFHSTYDTVVPYENLLSFIRNQPDLTYYFLDSERSRTKQAGVNPPHITSNQQDANVYIRDATCTKDHVKAGKDFFMLGASGLVVGDSPDMQLINWVLTGSDD